MQCTRVYLDILVSILGGRINLDYTEVFKRDCSVSAAYLPYLPPSKLIQALQCISSFHHLVVFPTALRTGDCNIWSHTRAQVQCLICHHLSQPDKIEVKVNTHIIAPKYGVWGLQLWSTVIGIVKFIYQQNGTEL